MSAPLVSRGVAVMGRVPKAGLVKTRLTTQWSPEEAAELYDAFLRDVFALVDEAYRSLQFRRIFSCVLFHPEELEMAQQMAPAGWTVVEQGPGDLGDRIEFSRLACGADHVLVLGSDAPCMPSDRILEAFDMLDRKRADLVLGPTDDGGYDLIGFPRISTEVLRDIPWSSPKVADVTRE